VTRGRTHAREALRGRGTRFLLYPQAPALTSIDAPETVWIAAAPEQIAPGPADARMYVVDAIDKHAHYDHPFLPPWRGARHPPVEPGPDGHFDHLAPGTRAFMAAHMYGTIRFVMDVWERYFGEVLPWHFEADYERLELVPLIDWNNAHSGYGFIETGYARPGATDPQPFCLNFDVLAHELGHSYVYQLLGTPPSGRVSAEFVAFHESAADCVAMLACLDFDSVVDRLLARTRGNLYLPNELNRIGELSDTEQLRLASQSVTLADIPSLRTPVERLSYPQRHDMSLPLTGAAFDVLTEVYQRLLVEDGLIDPELDAMSRQEVDPDTAAVQERFDAAYAGRHAEFKGALLDARDYLGRGLAAAWKTLSWNSGFSDVAAALVAADRVLSGGAGRDIILECYGWRGIEVPFGPRAGRRRRPRR